MSDSRWYFTEEQLESSPSRKCGISAELELSYRQRAANLIQEMGQRLQVYVKDTIIMNNDNSWTFLCDYMPLKVEIC